MCAWRARRSPRFLAVDGLLRIGEGVHYLYALRLAHAQPVSRAARLTACQMPGSADSFLGGALSSSSLVLVPHAPRSLALHVCAQEYRHAGYRLDKRLSFLSIVLPMIIYLPPCSLSGSKVRD
jgi:hypothetical protein